MQTRTQPIPEEKSADSLGVVPLQLASGRDILTVRPMKLPDDQFLEMIAGGVRLADIRESSCDKMDAQVPKIIPAVMMMDADYMRLQPLSKSQQVLDTPSKCIVRIPASLARQICETSKAQITSP